MGLYGNLAIVATGILGNLFKCQYKTKLFKYPWELAREILTLHHISSVRLASSFAMQFFISLFLLARISKCADT